MKGCRHPVGSGSPRMNCSATDLRPRYHLGWPDGGHIDEAGGDSDVRDEQATTALLRVYRHSTVLRPGLSRTTQWGLISINLKGVNLHRVRLTQPPSGSGPELDFHRVRGSEREGS